MDVPTGVRKTVLVRCEGRCERCGRWLANVPSSVHHRKARHMGGTSDPTINDPSNLVALCGTGTTGCHGWIESNRGTALTEGWLVSSWDDPARTPVIVGGEQWLVTADAFVSYRSELVDYPEGVPF
jgi:hypothetical protein